MSNTYTIEAIGNRRKDIYKGCNYPHTMGNALAYALSNSGRVTVIRESDGRKALEYLYHPVYGWYKNTQLERKLTIGGFVNV